MIAAVLFIFWGCGRARIYGYLEIYMQKENARAVEKTIWGVYRQMVRYFLRYSLIRAGKFTNDREQMKIIATYALVSCCILTCKVRHLRGISVLIDLTI